MNYKPRYPQPFTLAEATAFDVSVISEGRVVILKATPWLIVTSEISRLQNSLKYLKETQEVLKTALAETTEPPDAEIAEAFEENRIVIGSQEERITILKMAISEKGIISGNHYDLMPASVSQPLMTQPNPSHTTTSSSFTDATLSDLGEDGLYL